jgi:hypothetical protein
MCRAGPLASFTSLSVDVIRLASNFMVIMKLN